MNATVTTFLALLIGLIIYVVISMLIYSPFIFGPMWQRSKGITADDISASGSGILQSFAGGTLGTVGIYLLVLLFDVSNFLHGILVGLLVSTFTAGYGFNNVVYNKKAGYRSRVVVWLIDSLNIIVISVILGGFFGWINQ